MLQVQAEIVERRFIGASQELRLRAPAIAAHVLVVASVFLAHLHYAIDVAGAYAVTFALFALREGWPPRRGAGPVSP